MAENNTAAFLASIAAHGSSAPLRRERAKSRRAMSIGIVCFTISAAGMLAGTSQRSSDERSKGSPRMIPLLGTKADHLLPRYSGQVSTDGSPLLSIDQGVLCEQIALSVLLDFKHQISESEIIIQRDPQRPGMAVQQFAEAFGAAINAALDGSSRP